jgi:hypothetical protein
MPKLMLRRQCPSRIRHQLVLSLHQATSPRIPENSPANSPSVERWRTADRKRPLPIPLRRFFPAEWYLSPSSAHKSAFLLYHFLVLTVGCRGEILTEVWHALGVWQRSASGGGLRGTTREGPEALRHAPIKAGWRLRLISQRSSRYEGEERRAGAEEQVTLQQE